MNGFRVPGAWIDEVHALPPMPKRPFNFRELFVAPHSKPDPIAEYVLEVNRRLLQHWTGEILPTLPEPPEGMAWFPVVEMEPVDALDLMANTITYKIHPELRDA